MSTSRDFTDASGQRLHHRCLPRSPGGDVSHADDRAWEAVRWHEATPIRRCPSPHDESVGNRDQRAGPSEQPDPYPTRTLLEDVREPGP